MLSAAALKESIGTRLDRRKGIGPGFDFLRIALSFSIMAFHSWLACGREEDAAMGPAWIFIYALLPMFFALSGFLITGSAMRLRLRDFLINRGIRILPALAVEIICPLSSWARSSRFSRSPSISRTQSSPCTSPTSSA